MGPLGAQMHHSNFASFFMWSSPCLCTNLCPLGLLRKGTNPQVLGSILVQYDFILIMFAKPLFPNKVIFTDTGIRASSYPLWDKVQLTNSLWLDILLSLSGAGEGPTLWTPGDSAALIFINAVFLEHLYICFSV